MISVTKKRDHWEARDEKGNTAIGKTEELALRNYITLYERNSINAGIDFSKINIGGLDNESD